MFKKLFKKLPKMSSTPDFEKKKIFVYGTLKKNEPNHHVLCTGHGSSTFIGEGQTKEKYPLIIGTKYNIPFLLYSPGIGHQVQGEIYEVDYIMMGKLDALEDHPNFYTREEDEILQYVGNSHESVTCWVYFIKKFKEELLSKTTYETYSAYGDHGLVYCPSFETPVVTVKESEGLLTWRPVREKENEIDCDSQADWMPNTYLNITPTWKRVTETRDTETSAEVEESSLADLDDDVAVRGPKHE